MEEIFFLDGKRIETPPALRALFYGEGVFESFRWKGRAPVFLSMHLERMRRGARFLGIPFPSESAVRLHIEKSAAKAKGEDLHLKACLLGDGDTVFYSRPQIASLFVSVKHRVQPPKSVSVCVCGQRRSAKNRLFSHKTLNYLENVLAKRQALENGFEEVLFLDTDGNVAETSCHNVFWVKEKKLFTPSSECPVLPGVTREIILRLAARIGYETASGSFSIEELLSSDYVFLTNAVAGIVYVSGVDGDALSPPPGGYEILRKSLFFELGW
ncbi:MAG: aminotransferase class IV [Candidatus Dadabacteria bacterium]|nr:aminotransferase class IV [Candidatus Dadabacteria bacterium]MCY4262772.1 aminotransferase class IV [Candidatus Dadabacteria bacterium]